jgi:predicted nicotinamide N-methyase
LTQMQLLLLLIVCCQAAASLLHSTSTTTTSVANVAVHRVPLYRSNANTNNNDSSFLKSSSSTSSPYCFAVSNPMSTMPNSNFLATQVWPSARVAAMALERYIMMSSSLYNNEEDVKSLTICEFGCGPGLPSLTAAVISQQQQKQKQSKNNSKKPVAVFSKVYATDVDSFALELVQAAAKEQSVTDIVETRQIDLTTTSTTRDKDKLPGADLYLFSDVFESSAVARGAACTTCQALFNEKKNGSSSTVWVFCQSDRAQRQIYIQEMQRLLAERGSNANSDDDHVVDVDDFNAIQQSLSWQDHGDWPSISTTKRLWLCNVDETKVRYG